MSKVGVVLCRCNSLVDSNIDFNYLTEKMEKNKKVQSVIQLDMACSPQGIVGIKELAAAEEITRLVVAACSPLSKGEVFKACAGDFNILAQHIEIINLREQCAWAHESKNATKKAFTLLKMGIQRVARSQDTSNWALNCAYVNENKCDKCKRCVEECPNGAISLKEDGYPSVNPDYCQKCGICTGGCPLAVISLPGYKLDEISAMIKPAAKASSPAILGFFCDFTYEEADLMGQLGAGYSPNIYIIKVPCSGAVSMQIVNDAIAEGIDGVIIAGCENSQCKHKKGNELAKVRIENFRENLKEQLLEPERLTYLSLGEDIAETARIDSKKCSNCGICSNVCPFGAIRINESNKYEVYSEACRGCGTCAGTCSARAINLPGFEDEKLMEAINL